MKKKFSEIKISNITDNIKLYHESRLNFKCELRKKNIYSILLSKLKNK